MCCSTQLHIIDRARTRADQLRGRSPVSWAPSWLPAMGRSRSVGRTDTRRPPRCIRFPSWAAHHRASHCPTPCSSAEPPAAAEIRAISTRRTSRARKARRRSRSSLNEQYGLGLGGLCGICSSCDSRRVLTRMCDAMLGRRVLHLAGSVGPARTSWWVSYNPPPGRRLGRRRRPKSRREACRETCGESRCPARICRC